MFTAKDAFRDFILEYPVSDRSFDQITRVLGIIGEIQYAVEETIEKKDRTIDKLVELVEANEARSQISATSVASAESEPSTLDSAVQEYQKLVELCKVRHIYDDPPVEHVHIISCVLDFVSRNCARSR